MSSIIFRSAAPHAATVIALMSFVRVAHADSADAPDSPDAAVLPPIVVTAPLGVMRRSRFPAARHRDRSGELRGRRLQLR